MHQLVSVDMEKDLLEANRKLAEENHQMLTSRGIRSIDLMGSIGSGKTLLIEKMALELKKNGKDVGVITGDVVGDDVIARVTLVVRIVQC